MATNIAAANPPGELVSARWLILLGLITASIMEVLDTTIVNVALPTMAGNLGATVQDIAWVSTGYILSNVVVLPMTAFLTARFGRKRYLTFSIFLFIISSFFCGTSHSLGELVVWRILQGAGGAALLSTAQATLRQIFPKEEQGLVQAIFLLGVIVAPTIGPTLGGWITDNYTWSWCFFINIPIGLTSIALVTTFLQDPDTPLSTARIDWLGIGLLALGLGSLQYVLEEGQKNDWFNDAWIVRWSIVSAVSLISMLVWELSPRNKAPVVNFRVLHNKQLSACLFLFLSLGFGLFGGIYIFPVFTQDILGFTPTQTGLALLPGGLATAFSALVCGRLLNGAKPLVDLRLLLCIGVILFMTSMWMLGHMTPQSGEASARFALLIRGLGLGLLFTPINMAAFSSLKPQEIQQASGLINLSRQLGGSFGIAVLATYVANMSQFHRINLIQNYNSANPAFTSRLQGLTATLHSHGSSLVDAQQQAYTILEQTLMRQSRTLAYDNAFMLILMCFVCTAPAILLIRKPKTSAGPTQGGGH
ncbi:multidrug resistance protein [Capsulimonas corticalis]|uniref:Multidrug resistance protein n=1 Tax=Capsulimonas corticalis TaxID=2219043 RepID=A0A402CV65_9BACT|nr:DHA2 family efflux MFS transporter permease subunit [Capsulimonas corticalis]BDI30295.1 multidrug resistance protein [Capsulimonas corticalis]